MKHTISYQQAFNSEFDESRQMTNSHLQVLEDYLDQLLWWNRRVNLVSRNVPRETIWKHIRHSLAINRFSLFSENGLIVDAGTGGGLPGIPLAITNPEKRFILNDVVTKKVLAIRQMVQQLELKNVTVMDASVKDLDVQEPFLLISKHAFKIGSLFSMTRHLPWTQMVFYKGLDFEDELKEISIPLSVSVYDFSASTDDPFYKDKGLIVVSRSAE